MLQLGGVPGVHGHSGAVHVQLPHNGGAALQPCLPGLGAAGAPPQPQQAHLQRAGLPGSAVGAGGACAQACLPGQAAWQAPGAEGAQLLRCKGLVNNGVRSWQACPDTVPQDDAPPLARGSRAVARTAAVLHRLAMQALDCYTPGMQHAS